MPKIKLSELKPPTWYIRRRLSQQNFEDLLTVGKSSKSWPFPDIEVVKLSAAELEKLSKSKKTKDFRYEVIDGWTRTNVAEALKLPSISAKILNLTAPKARFIEQYTTNATHGLRLDKDERDEAIRHMGKEFKMKEAEIAKITGLSQQSISRVIHNRQRGSSAKATREAQRQAYADSPAEVFVRVQTGLANFIELHEDVIDHLAKGIKEGSIPKSVIDDMEKNLLKTLELIRAFKE